MNRRSPPRLVVRTTITTFAIVTCVLSSVLLALTLNLRDYVRGSVADKLEAGQRMLSALEQRRAHELGAQVATLAENPTLKAAIDTYRAEFRTGDVASRRELVTTIENELKKVFDRTQPDILAVRSAAGELLAVAGDQKGEWAAHASISNSVSTDEFVTLSTGVFRVASASIALNDVVLGRLELATALDDSYAAELSTLSGAAVVIASPRSIVASTLPPAVHTSLSPGLLARAPDSSTIRIGDENYATQLLFRAGDAAVFALDSIDASEGPAMIDAARSVSMIALAAFALAGGAQSMDGAHACETNRSTVTVAVGNDAVAVL